MTTVAAEIRSFGHDEINRARGWVQEGMVFYQLLEPLLRVPQADQELEYLWKYYGFMGGSVVLDALIYGSCELRYPTDATGLKALRDQGYPDALARKGTLAAHLMPVN